ncbi:Exocyst complex protein exo70 [Colletotrichum orbiculare MAFF 240422]|uniref:Exocyst complex protein EXO70 n=1 Tax=Colletotrichum orbiculare (strain 104-T / ATCC 96160 / CBS 514.97 / LARS 414 / MAFF 240422) TaxID=1213857 RepID=A0A484G4Z9_COLOR|nr:Exocyst complex protein exo70 [Colletotrichum orbiculare MAFF 240422]
MSVGSMTSHHAADEEARAEIQSCMGRLETTGKSVREVAGPLSGETKKLQILGNNIDAVLAAIERLRQPADSKNDEEQIIRAGPDKCGLSNYLSSIKRLSRSFIEMQNSNLRANQQTMAELVRMIKSGNSQLEGHFDKLIREEKCRRYLPRWNQRYCIFTREDWGPLFQATCHAATAELARTLRELNHHIKAHLHTDCYLAYEITEIISGLSSNLETRTGELKTTLAAALRPVRDTAKLSLGELLDDTRRKISAMLTLPQDGAPIPIVTETMQRLQTMVEFLRPISNIMFSLGDGGWKSIVATDGRLIDAMPSLATFDIGADGKEIFAHYCADTVETLLSSLDAKAKMVFKGGRAVMGVFMANNVVIIERMIRDSDLAPLLEQRMSMLDQWRKKATALYTIECKEVSAHLFDVIHTSKQRPTSGQADSASILKGLSSRDKDNIKGKFQAFNASFDDMVHRHKGYAMEKEVRQMFARDIQQMLEPLYNRFWDRYHEVDKGKGKHVKYDKTGIAAVFTTLF